MMNSILIYITIVLFVASLAVARLTYKALVEIKESLIIPKEYYNDYKIEYELIGIQRHDTVNNLGDYNIGFDLQKQLIQFMPKKPSHVSYVAEFNKKTTSLCIIGDSCSNTMYIAYYFLQP